MEAYQNRDCVRSFHRLAHLKPIAGAMGAFDQIEISLVHLPSHRLSVAGQLLNLAQVTAIGLSSNPSTYYLQAKKMAHLLRVKSCNLR